ncbi:WhiB family transcriptional regulator [Streptomyces sp. S1D4-20]|nr:WhiB family transcriptional regulator [Streptomyces sp. S1D4-20]
MTTTQKNWRHQAACLTKDPELWFPAGDSGPYLHTIEQAKAICAACPVTAACLQYALTEGIDSGIFGGLNEKERRSIRRTARRQKAPLTQVAARKKAKPARPTTMRGIFNAGATPLPHGHAAWTTTRKIHFQGQVFTPKQFAFTLDRGRAPEGRVTSECGVTNCILPAHLKDQQERGICGTRNGYQLHLREKTEICPPCRRANADADNRLRRTGTTKAAVSEVFPLRAERQALAS